MTKEEFEESYCRRSNITLEVYHRWKVTLPCECTYEGCQGWAAIPNDPSCIEDHMKFYMPLSKGLETQGE